MAEKLRQKYTALITGASNGIGLELAELFARDGHDLVLVARSEEKLNNLALKLAIQHKVYAKVIVQDLAKAEGPQRVFDELKQTGVAIDVLVNNAGFGDFGYFKETDLQKDLDMMQLNMVTLTHLTKLFLHQLPSDRKGRILNISSMAAFVPGPLMAVYYASKAYVQSFSEALSEELKEADVTVTALCPGSTDTGFKERANLDSNPLFKTALMADAKSVAEAGYKGMLAGEVVVIPGFKNKAGAVALKLMPRSIVRTMIKKIQDLRQ